MKSITPEEFFKRVAVNSEVVDMQTVKNIYYGLIRTLSQELKNRQTISIPDWGTFNLKIHKSRRFEGCFGKDPFGGMVKKISILPPVPKIKFVVNPNVDKYFKALGTEGTMIK